MKHCPLCEALGRLAEIDDEEADSVVLSSDMSAWCPTHVRVWLATRTSSHRGKDRLKELLRAAGVVT